MLYINDAVLSLPSKEYKYVFYYELFVQSIQTNAHEHKINAINREASHFRNLFARRVRIHL